MMDLDKAHAVVALFATHEHGRWTDAVWTIEAGVKRYVGSCDGRRIVAVEVAAGVTNSLPQIEKASTRETIAAALVDDVAPLKPAPGLREFLNATAPCTECGGAGHKRCDRCDGTGKRPGECEICALAHDCACSCGDGRQFCACFPRSDTALLFGAMFNRPLLRGPVSLLPGDLRVAPSCPFGEDRPDGARPIKIVGDGWVLIAMPLRGDPEGRPVYPAQEAA